MKIKEMTSVGGKSRHPGKGNEGMKGLGKPTRPEGFGDLLRVSRGNRNGPGRFPTEMSEKGEKTGNSATETHKTA